MLIFSNKQHPQLPGFHMGEAQFLFWPEILGQLAAAQKWKNGWLIFNSKVLLGQCIDEYYHNFYILGYE